MEKPKYYSFPLFYLIILVFFALGVIFLFCFQQFIPAILCLIILLLWQVPLIVFRKNYFKKIIINERGITFFYKQKITNDIRWEDIKDALAIPKGIILLDEPINLIEAKKNALSWIEVHRFFISFKSKYFLVLCKYKNKIPVDIRDLEKINQLIAKQISKELTHNKK